MTIKHSDIAVLIADPQAALLEITKESSVEDLTTDSFGEVEDHAMNLISELSDDHDRLNKAIDLLNANGLQNMGDMIGSLVKAHGAREYLKENLDDF